MLSRVFTRKEQFILLAASFSICLGAVVIMARHAGRPSATLPSASPLNPGEPAETPAIPDGSPPSSPAATALPQTSRYRESPTTAPLLGLVTVSVRGAVESPGVYEIPAGGHVTDLIARAGGAQTEADLSDINLAATLLDGTTLHIPRRATGRVAGGRLVVRGSTAGRVVNPPQYTLSGWRPPQEPDSGTSSNSASVATGTDTNLVNINAASQKELEALPGVGPVTAAAIIECRRERRFRSVDDLIRARGIGPKKMETLRAMVTVSP